MDKKTKRQKRQKRQKYKDRKRQRDKKTKRQLTKTQKTVRYCDVRAVSHSCDVLVFDLIPSKISCINNGAVNKW